MMDRQLVKFRAALPSSMVLRILPNQIFRAFDGLQLYFYVALRYSCPLSDYYFNFIQISIIKCPPWPWGVRDHDLSIRSTLPDSIDTSIFSYGTPLSKIYSNTRYIYICNPDVPNIYYTLKIYWLKDMRNTKIQLKRVIFHTDNTWSF